MDGFFATESIFTSHLDTYEQNLVSQLTLLARDTSKPLELIELWRYDYRLGGIGAYCLPSNPGNNPFRGGLSRDIFRPLQYARMDMEVLNIHLSTRHIIRDVGLHLERVLANILRWNSFGGEYRFTKDTIGQLAHKLCKRKLIDEHAFKMVMELTQVYNKSKHEINMDEDRPSSFSVGDSLVFYIASRKIANGLLNPYYTKVYEQLEEAGIRERFIINEIM